MANAEIKIKPPSGQGKSCENAEKACVFSRDSAALEWAITDLRRFLRKFQHEKDPEKAQGLIAETVNAEKEKIFRSWTARPNTGFWCGWLHGENLLASSCLACFVGAVPFFRAKAAHFRLIEKNFNRKRVKEKLKNG